MDTLQWLIDSAKRDSFKINHSYNVCVTHVNNPHSFYVRPCVYNQYMETVQARGDPINQSEIKIGAIVIFKSEVAEDYVRGKIILMEGDDKMICDLFALDIGCVENCVPLEKIWKPYYEVKLPALSFHCQLANCIPRTDIWNESTINAMRGFVEGKTAMITIKSIMPEVFMVEVQVSNPDDLATLLAITRHTAYSYMDDMDYQLMIYYSDSDHFYSERILQVKSVLHVRLQSGFFIDKFYAAQVDEYKLFLEDQNEYTAYAENEQALNYDQIKVGAPVGVLYYRTSKYERGIVRELIPNKRKVKVELVDWGKIIDESADKIRPIPDQFLCKPPLAICCALHVSQYSKMGLSEISYLSKVSYSGVEFFMKFEEVSDKSDSPNLVSIFGIKTG